VDWEARGLKGKAAGWTVASQQDWAQFRGGRFPDVSRVGDEAGELLVVQGSPALRRGGRGERCKPLRRSRLPHRHHGDIPRDQHHRGEKDRNEHQGEDEDHLPNVPDVRCTTPGPKVPPSPDDQPKLKVV
jgi:hypothetical protein